MTDQKFDREYFDGVFDENIKVKVEFTKKDGSNRVMLCTKNMDIIPPENHPKPLKEGEEPKAPSDVVCNIWDLESNGWRSFRYDSVLKVTIVE